MFRITLILSCLFAASLQGDISDTEANKGTSRDGFVTIGGKEYYTKYGFVSAQAANEFCNSLGMRLISLESQEKNQLIKDYLNTTSFETYWSSGLKFMSTWMWAGSGQLFGHTDWVSGNPSYPQECNVCVYFFRDGWSDYPCFAGRATFCEY